MSERPLILVTNDDGVHAPGIRALAAGLDGAGEVWLVAPDREASASSQSLTLKHPLRAEKVDSEVFAVDGTPADCVNLGVVHVLTELPDLVVSGINKGYNLGDDVTYSGTVGGALEGALLGTPGIAVSLQRTGEPFDFGPAAAATERIAAQVLRHGLPARTLLNVNVPRGVPKGARVTVQGMRNHVTRVAASMDPRGRPYYWIEEGEDTYAERERADHVAVREGYVSVTPLQPDLTAHAALALVEKLV
jgi:5'-nucleotidase